jgi:hybrid cluster-associated redox disulfide protein
VINLFFVKTYLKEIIMKVSKDMTVGEILNKYSNAQEVLSGFGLHCFGCPMSQMETVEQAANAHGVDVEFMMSQLEKDLVANKPAKTCKRSCKK